MTRTQALPALIIFLGICFGVEMLTAQLTTPNLSGWYNELNKPEWTPPHWVFGPVWTSLYAMMAVAAWLVWHRGSLLPTSPPLLLFFLQLVLNALWSALFFAHQQPGLAFFEIVLLWFAILATIIFFWRIERLAGLLLIPYLAWVAFTAALNFTIWQMNS